MLQVNSQWVSSACSHTSIKNTLQQIVSVSHKQCDRIIPRYMFDRNYVVEIPSRSDWIRNKCWTERRHRLLYTDGSRMESRKLTGASLQMSSIRHTTSTTCSHY